MIDDNKSSPIIRFIDLKLPDLKKIQLDYMFYKNFIYAKVVTFYSFAQL